MPYAAGLCTVASGMLEHVIELLRSYLVQYGYTAVAVALLLENAGLPVPGETVLLLASFLAFSEHQLHLSYIILVGILAAIIGDNIGYAVGRYGGRPMLERYRRVFFIRATTLAKAERLFERYGARTVLLARFVAGLRIVAGPLAGALRMDWMKFLICNCLGAALWVCVIAGVGYLFGEYQEQLIRGLHRANFWVFVAVCVVLLYVWWRRSRKTERQD